MSFALSAPLPAGIAINLETRECGRFWGGDEYGSYSLPDRWNVYYPSYVETSPGVTQQADVIKTEFGECTFRGFGWGEAGPCCNKLGLKYVGDVGVREGIFGFNWFWVGVVLIACLIFLGLCALAVLMFIDAIKKKSKLWIVLFILSFITMLFPYLAIAYYFGVYRRKR
ncbi:hypothetical protein FJZ53_04125 [Candidatus Woesearchaeota archaeon]|nr:hypothetical protein [Candidatus Woesearchaeota archaeon]